MREVEVTTNQFLDWRSELTDDQRELLLPAAQGRGAPGLVHVRIRRQVVLLLGGDKSGAWNDWYEWAVPVSNGPVRRTSRAEARRVDLMARTKYLDALGERLELAAVFEDEERGEPVHLGRHDSAARSALRFVTPLSPRLDPSRSYEPRRDGPADWWIWSLTSDDGVRNPTNADGSRRDKSPRHAS